MHATSTNVSATSTSTVRAKCAPQPDRRLQIGEQLVSLQEGTHLRLHDGKCHGVTALRGTLWITRDGDVRDWILEQGESVAFARDSDILISAMSDATIRLDDAPGFAH